MSSSKEIFALRKVGAIDEAYELVKALMATGTDDTWDIKACAWCLIDLVKRESKIEGSSRLAEFQQQLFSLKLDPNDELLQKQLHLLQSLYSPRGKLIAQAKASSKENQHDKALELYRKIFTQPVEDQYVHMDYGWTLYRVAKSCWDVGANHNATQVKRYLNEYFRLNIEKPSLLHTCILQLAKNLAREQQLRIAPFFKLWGNHFREEDYLTSTDKHGKSYPCLAESVLQMAGKEAIRSHDRELIEYFLPFLQDAIQRFPENIWFKYYLAKSLIALGDFNQAKAFCVNVCKAKQSDSWAWGLVAEVYAYSDQKMSLACYCKALLCKNEESHKVRLRTQLAKLLVDQHEFAKAKFEIQQVLNINEKISADLQNIMAQAWFNETEMAKSNQDLYLEHVGHAENIIYENLAWLNANVADKFVLPEKNKTKYKIVLQTEKDSIETSVSEHMLRSLNVKLGMPIQIKGEFDDKNIFRVYLVKPRVEGDTWDALASHLAVADSINHDKKLFHYIVDKNKDGILPFSAFPVKVTEGDVIEIKTAIYTSKSGQHLRVFDLRLSDQVAPNHLIQQFSGEYVRTSGAVGFTDSDFFIPPHLMKKHNIQENDLVTGVAVLNFNQKKRSWGWKVLKVTDVIS